MAEGFRIPKARDVRAAVLEVMREMGCIDSIVLLRELVLDKLRESDDRYALSPRRLRKIMARMEELTIVISTSESRDMTRRLGGDKALVKLTRCPVCGSKLKPIRNQTLYGWIVVIEKKCPVCGYWTGTRIRKPYRYEVCLRG